LENILIGKKNISTLLPLPKKFILEFLNSVDLKDKPANKISEAELEKLKTLQNYQFSPAGNFGYSKAEVTKGGISTDEVNSQTMESKLQKNLYFLGEALNVTGELGGYNFQFAFSSAITCANLI
jgi:predicted flavoprotein YhiN